MFNPPQDVEPPAVEKVTKQRTRWEELIVLLIFLVLLLRFTTLVAWLGLALVYLFFPRHQSRRAITAGAFIFFAAAFIPVDIYIPYRDGRIINSTHSGPRFVRVLYELSWPTPGHEALLGGCEVSFDCTRWKFVWD